MADDQAALRLEGMVIDLFFPIIPRHTGRIVRGVVDEENQVERKKRLRREAQRRYVERNREKVYAGIKRYVAANKEKHYARINAWREKNPERVLQAARNYRKRERAKQLEKQCETR